MEQLKLQQRQLEEARRQQQQQQQQQQAQQNNSQSGQAALIRQLIQFQREFELLYNCKLTEYRTGRQ